MDAIGALMFAIEHMEHAADNENPGDFEECIATLRALATTLLPLLGQLDPRSAVLEKHAADVPATS